MATSNNLLDTRSFYHLPFEEGTFYLTEETLNKHSKFRRPERFYAVKIRNVHYKNELLTLGVKIKEEKEQLVYLKVCRHELLVSCNVDTDSSYLSLYAYFGLLTLMEYRAGKNFEEYYWPDFFDPHTGKSPFLKIYNDRRGLDIELKTNYPHFYRPGDQLIDWYPETELSTEIPTDKRPLDLSHSNDPSLGFFIADTYLKSIYSNHYSFLVPFQGVLTKDRQKIKSFTSFLFNNQEVINSDCSPSPDQSKLIEISFKMRELVPVGPDYWRAPFRPDTEEKENGTQLLKLWHLAKEFLVFQQHVYHYQTHGLRYLNGKPRRSWIKLNRIQRESPQLVIKKVDKGRYYQLELKFRVKRKTMTPEKYPICFFLKSTDEPEKLYLLNHFRDFQLILFFSHFNYKIAVLKPHYQDEFKEFVDHLAKHYPIIEV